MSSPRWRASRVRTSALIIVDVADQSLGWPEGDRASLVTEDHPGRRLTAFAGGYGRASWVASLLAPAPGPFVDAR
ncbi:MAG: hypothetical protein ACREOS_07070, partial [Candidatus Dormibacteraceae bacterium]